ncbi:MAG: ABC transporter permease, partial [Lachnospiraceae bacterium]|nr:ABC transporter permease [Lachnospiraceae bacterium]
MSDKAKASGKRSRRTRILAGLGIFFLLLAAAIGALKNHFAASLYDQREGERWGLGGGAAQISCFYGSGQTLKEEEIPELNYQLEEILKGRSVSQETLGVPETARLFALGYSGLGQVEITGGDRTFTVNAVGAGGDFFLFHPVRLLSGSYFSGEDLMKDRILIDEETAWTLFGSPDCVGKSLDIGGVPHYISGVYRREDDSLTRKAGSARSLVYISFDSLSRYSSGGFVTAAYSETSAVREDYGLSEEGSGGSDAGDGSPSSSEEETAGITCLETVLPNPVDGFALGIMKEVLGSGSGMTMVDNTARYRDEALLDLFLGFTSRGMQTKGISYPFWENRARAWENILSLVFMGYCLCLFAAAVILVILIIGWYRHRKWNSASLVRKASDWIYDMQSERARISAGEKDPDSEFYDPDDDSYDYFDDEDDPDLEDQWFEDPRSQ